MMSADPLGAHRLAPVPGLADLQADPGLLDRLTLHVLADLRRQVRHLDADLEAAITRRLAQPHGQPAAPAEPDRLLKPEEAARLAGMTPNWFRRHGKDLPFARKLSRKALRFSEAGLRRWITSQRP